jgi:hypothetical protein
MDDLAVAFRIEKLETMDKDNSISRSNLVFRPKNDFEKNNSPLTPIASDLSKKQS